MADTMFPEKVSQSHMAGGSLNCDTAGDAGLPANSTSIAGTWINKDNLAYGQLMIKLLRFDEKEHEVAMDCTIGQTREKFLGFYYAWPNDRFYLVLQKAENGLQEHYMFVSLLRDSPEGPYMIADMTGSIRYTRL